MKVIVCGSRTFHDRAVVNTVLNGFWWPTYDPGDDQVVSHHNLTIIEGGARGADAYAADWARAHDGVALVEYPADWKTHQQAAGPIRNQLMLDDQVEIDLVIAFVNKDLERSVGTFDMVRKARGAGIPVWVVEVRPVEPRRPRPDALPGL